MFNLFGTTVAETPEPQETHQQEQFSRFNASEDSAPALRKIGKLTRFGVKDDVERDVIASPSRVTPKRPERLVPRHEAEQTQPRLPRSQHVNENAHLHEDGHIPLWVIRKALPERFSQTSIADEDFAFR